MGPHKTQQQKLTGLRERLANDQSIDNREIRAALGVEDYKIYEQKLTEAKTENDQLKSRERTPGQKHAEELIKTVLRLDGRGADSTVWMDRAGEALDGLTEAELHEMNYWVKNADTGTVEFDQLAAIDRPSIYVDAGYRLNETIADLKKRVLSDTVDRLLGKDSVDEQAVKKDNERLRRLLKSVSDDD